MDASSTNSAHAGLGEPRDGFPSWEERVVHVWTNRARAAPADELASCTACADRGCYSPQPPLSWQHELARAARFHSELQLRSGCSGVQHDSPCTLVPDIAASFTPGPCAGDPACACTAGSFACGTRRTTFADRLASFGFGSGIRAENLVVGAADPLQSFYTWLREPDSTSTCEARFANGHRFNILASTFRGVGVGKAGSIYTQDFTSLAAVPSGIVGAVHYPRTGATVELRANWYGSVPTRAEVNVEGRCQSMTLERGTELNGTFLATESGLGSGCYRYAFSFSSSAGEQTFPSTGSFGIGCGADWLPSVPPACGSVASDAGAPAALDAGVDAGTRRGRGRRPR
jgi:hypothetical protein